MSRLIMRFFALAGIALTAASLQLQARAESLSAEDSHEVQAVILAQLKAFAEDDAEAAFETATPEVRKSIGEATRFLALVRGNYPMVYRPAAFGFLAPEVQQDQVLQVVSIRDADDKTWLALFLLERQPDRSWRISSCMVAENDWRST